MGTLILIVVALALAGGLIVAVIQLVEARERLGRYGGIRDLDQHKAKLARGNEQAQRQLAEKKRALAEFQSKSATLEQELKGRITALEQELRSVEEAVEIQSFGFYRPRYGLESSTAYKARLTDVRAQQKQLIKDDGAAHCPASWTVEGSEAKGRKMVKEQKKLMLRAFNGECDAAIAKVKYDNILILAKRIEKSFDAINRLGKSKQTSLTQEYLQLKLEELGLVHEHREKVQEEKEEQRRIKEQMREEQRAQKEVEKAQAEAEKEEARQQKALEKARRELAEATDAQHEKLEELVARLENELKEVLDRKAKAIARAQLTRSGHVYVISNIGSFGEGIYKIGMTRRLEPSIRVKELGDASVPFLFDVHAMIYSEDAPTLEKSLHQQFEDRRVNKVNTRKEFFRVSLEEVRAAVEKHHGVITFVTVPEAEEYRKTVAIEEEAEEALARVA